MSRSWACPLCDLPLKEAEEDATRHGEPGPPFCEEPYGEKCCERSVKQREQMKAMRLEETVTITREIKGPVRDLVGFVRYLAESGKIQSTSSTEELVKLARAFWEREHGED